jgi:hypothetical protein
MYILRVLPTVVRVGCPENVSPVRVTSSEYRFLYPKPRTAQDHADSADVYAIS